MPFNLPNMITVTRIIMIFVALVLATHSGLPGTVADSNDLLLRYIAFALAFLAGVSDLVDGYLARKWNQVTDFGALMDPLADKVFVTVSMLFMVAFQLIPAWVAAMVISREFMVTGLRMLATKQGKVISADKFGKLKTFLQMIMLLQAGLIWMEIFDKNITICGKFTYSHFWIFYYWLVVVVTVGSGVNYFIKNRDLVSGSNSQK